MNKAGKTCIVASSRKRIGKKKIKSHGRIWDFHKNDKDPFPSRPHGHNGREKLDIDRGIIYDAITKKPVEIISKKELSEIREKLKKSKFI